LASGKSIFVGSYNGNLIVSDGVNHYIEKHFAPKPLGFIASAACLLAHLTQVYSLSLISRAKHRHDCSEAESSAPASGQLDGYNRVAKVAYLPPNNGLNKINTWFTGTPPLFALPQAEAQAAVPTHLEKGLAILRGHDKQINSIVKSPRGKQRRSLDYLHHSLKMTFQYHHHNKAIYLPNTYARNLLITLQMEFKETDSSPQGSIKQLLSFDNFIGHKVADIFYQGLYLKDKNKSINIIIIKASTEKIIDEIRILAGADEEIKELLLKYDQTRTRVSDYLVSLESQLSQASELVNYQTIIDTVEIQKGLSFDDAKQKALDNAMAALGEEQNRIYQIHDMLDTMESAFDSYCAELTIDDDPTLDRVIYLSNLAIYDALIEGDNPGLITQLHKLHFYDLFEYTRSNGISVPSKNFLVPGEMTEDWRLFEPDEEMLTKQKVEDIFMKELLDFNNQRTEGHPIIDHLLKIIEVVRLNEKYIIDDNNWKNKTLLPYRRVHDIFSNIIESGSLEKDKTSTLSQWYKDEKIILKKTQISFIILEYLNGLQKIFIDCIAEMYDKKLTTTGHTHEQRIASAKILAIQCKNNDQHSEVDDYDLLKKYENNLLAGEFNLLIKAATFWYFQHISHDVIKQAYHKDALYVIEKFISAQIIYQQDYSFRFIKSYTSLYELKSSSKYNDLEQYYKQFIEYKLHDSYYEARRLTAMAIEKSSMNYLDLIYPPKDIFSFKIYSRNYVKNPITPMNYVYHPSENTGYLSLIVAKTNKLYLFSSLAGISFIQDISHLAATDFVKRLKTAWPNPNHYLGLKIRDRLHIPAPEVDVFFLLSSQGGGTLNANSLIGLLLKQPESLRGDSQHPPFTVVAISKNDIHSVIKKYIITEAESSKKFQHCNSIITAMDYITHATLIETADKIKEISREHTFDEYLTSLLPFYEILHRYWHDEEYEVAFGDIIYEVFDIIITIASTANGLGKVGARALNKTLQKAIDRKIPHKLMKQFIIAELTSSFPDFILEGSPVLLREILNFLNPVPFSEKLVLTLKNSLSQTINKKLAIMNDAIKLKNALKRNNRKKWRASLADDGAIQPNHNGIFYRQVEQKEIYYIKEDNDYYQVIKDSESDDWRVVDSRDVASLNTAVSITRSRAGKWIASAQSLPGSRKSIFTSLMKENNDIKGLDIIKFEPPPSFSTFESFDLNRVALISFHQKVLRYYLSHNTFVHELTKGSIPKDTFLDRAYKTLNLRKEIIDLMYSQAKNIDEFFILKAYEAIDTKTDGIIKFRAITAWKTQHDHQPETHHALRIEINGLIYIIDLMEVRQHLKLNDRRDVFTQHEWLMMFRSELSSVEPSIRPLIKYKDFDLKEDAEYFSYREAAAPTFYIHNGVTLNEPEWYRPAVIGEYLKTRKLEYGMHRRYKHDYRSVIRAIRLDTHRFLNNEDYIIEILYKCGNIDKGHQEILRSLVKDAKINNLISFALFANKVRITSMNELLRVNEGKFLAFYHSGVLKHLLLSVGNGKFVGSKNNFFDPIIPNRGSVIIGEQLGFFHQNLLMTRQSERHYVLMAGTPFGVKDTYTILAEHLPTIQVPTYHADGRIVAIEEKVKPRAQVLLGMDASVDLINDVRSRLRIKLHGAPFNVNNMDAIEFSDILRGLHHVEGLEFKLDELQSIELYSCFGGYGGRYSLAQILANELNKEIKAYPSKVSEEIRSRRPEWYRVFYPTAENADINHSLPNGYWRATDAQNIHRHLHDFAVFIRNARKRLPFHRQKREYRHIATLYIKILYAIIPNVDIVKTDVDSLNLSPSSASIMKEIINEYALQEDSEDEFIDQAFMEILLSVPEYNHLTKQFSEELAGNSTANE